MGTKKNKGYTKKPPIASNFIDLQKAYGTNELNIPLSVLPIQLNPVLRGTKKVIVGNSVTGLGTLYTIPSNKRFVVSFISITNTNASAVATQGASILLIDKDYDPTGFTFCNVYAGISSSNSQSFSFATPITWAPSSTIQYSTGGSVSAYYTIYGYEIDI